MLIPPAEASATEPATSSQEGQAHAAGDQPAHAAAQFPEIPPSVLPPARMAHDDGQDAMGDRLFRTTALRTQVSLNGWWDFVSDPDDTGESNHFFENFPAAETALWAPGTWNAQARYWQYVGKGWYHRRFDWPQTGDMLLRFSAVFYRAKVWLDGKLLGENEQSYLPFTFLVRGLSKGSHALVVSADNRLSEGTLPKISVDWFPYGGLHRPVYAESVPDVFIESWQVGTASMSASKAHLRVTAWVRNSGPATTCPVSLFVDNQSLLSQPHSIPSGANEITFDFDLPNPRAWSPEGPNLYAAHLVIGDDDQFTRFGVRTISTSGHQILLNGQAIKIRGVNRHDDHPDWGSAVPPHLIRQDVEIIKRLGANAVRIHYPVADMFLDYCDQNGLLFLSEIPTWQYRPAQLDSPILQEKTRHYFSAMVKRDGGHTCVLYWSLGNEWPEPDQSYDAIKALVDYARGVDPSHLIAIVTGGPAPYRVHALVDIIGVNWAEYQWYDSTTSLDARAGGEAIRALEPLHAQYPNKPVIITEFGAAESQAGWHNWGNVKWSEEYQARNVADSGRYSLEQEWISGGCVWQYADSRTAPSRNLQGRLHGWNCKGVVAGDRSPKLTFYVLQELYRRHQPTEG